MIMEFNRFLFVIVTILRHFIVHIIFCKDKTGINFLIIENFTFIKSNQWNGYDHHHCLPVGGVSTGGTVTGGTVTGGRIGGTVTGGTVTGGLIGGTITGGRVIGGFTIGGRVIGGFTIGGRVTGGFTTGPFGPLGLCFEGGLPQEPQPKMGVAEEIKSMEMKRRALNLEDSILLFLSLLCVRERSELRVGFLEMSERCYIE